MPTYDYGCSACGHVVEVIHGINEAGPRFCPNCGKEGTMRKAFATPAVHFKGSGWAKKDRSATSTPGKSRGASTTDASSSSDKASGKDADSAPAKSADPAPAKSSDAD